MLNETRVALRGNVATDPVLKVTQQGTTVCSFRLAVTARRWSAAEGAMVDGETSFYTVTCWRTLAENAVGSLHKGHSVLVQGRLRVRDFVHEGQPRTSADVTADVVGADLSWGTTSFTANRRPRPDDVRDDSDRSEADLLATQVSAQPSDPDGGSDGRPTSDPDDEEPDEATAGAGSRAARAAEPAF